MSDAADNIAQEIVLERKRQIEKWGVQHRPEGNDEKYKIICDMIKANCDSKEKKGPLPGYTGGADWKTILHEEFLEATCEPDKAKRRKELIQVAAVCVAWIEDMDSHP